jgi:hypothetical protein
MILVRNYYNNGYGCSCCRSDWEEVDWINESDMLSFEELIALAKESKEHVTDDDYHCGTIYQKDGKTLYGFTTKIYRSPIEISLVVGNKSFVVKSIYEREFNEDNVNTAREEYKRIHG